MDDLMNVKQKLPFPVNIPKRKAQKNPIADAD
jgi:hypothetical protein